MSSGKMHTPLRQPWYAAFKMLIKQAVSLQSLLQAVGDCFKAEKWATPLEPKRSSLGWVRRRVLRAAALISLACGSWTKQPLHLSPFTLIISHEWACVSATRTFGRTK